MASTSIDPNDVECEERSPRFRRPSLGNQKTYVYPIRLPQESGSSSLFSAFSASLGSRKSHLHSNPDPFQGSPTSRTYLGLPGQWLSAPWSTAAGSSSADQMYFCTGYFGFSRVKWLPSPVRRLEDIPPNMVAVNTASSNVAPTLPWMTVDVAVCRRENALMEHVSVPFREATEYTVLETGHALNQSRTTSHGLKVPKRALMLDKIQKSPDWNIAFSPWHPGNISSTPVPTA